MGEQCFDQREKINTDQEKNWGLKTAFFYTGLGAPFAIAAWFIIPEPAG
jgi:hypothetical protein